MVAIQLIWVCLFQFNHHPVQLHLPGYLNDLWQFNIVSEWWTWLNGSSTVADPGVYGTKGLAAPTNKPGGRWYHSMILDQETQVLLMFGGNGYDIQANMNGTEIPENCRRLSHDSPARFSE